jgi:hypothetical protein
MGQSSSTKPKSGPLIYVLVDTQSRDGKHPKLHLHSCNMSPNKPRSVYSGINIPWLQAAPTAFKTIGYFYYIIFIIFSAFGALMAFFVFPDTLHKSLEEVAALFGDRELVVVYQQELKGAGGEIALSEIEASIPGYKSVDPVGTEKQSIERVEHV